MKTLNDELKMGCLLTAGNINDYNTMTIGWATTGILWNRNVFICFVKKNRYTYEFMEKYDKFTISFFSEQYKNTLRTLGTLSGRDTDKVKISGLKPIELDGCVSFKQASKVIVCNKIYVHDIDKTKVPEFAMNNYYQVEPEHVMYVGEIIEEIEN